MPKAETQTIKKSDVKKMEQATSLTKPESNNHAVIQIPAIGTGKMVTIDPKNVRSFEDVGLGTGLFPDDVQIGMESLVGKEFLVVDAKTGLKGVIAGKETEYGVVRCWTENGFSFLPPDAPEYDPVEDKKEYDEIAIQIEPGQFFTTATGGVVAYRQVQAALSEGLLPLKTSVWQSRPKAKGMNGYYYFGTEAKASK